MSNWKLYSEQPKIEKSEVSKLQIFLGYLLALLLVTLMRLSTWPENKHVDYVFFSQCIFLSILAGSAIMFYYIMLASTTDYYRESRIKIAEWQLYNVKNYAGKHLAIAGWSSLTPINNIALQMLKLEGEFPLAPKTPVRLNIEPDFDATRLRKIFIRLLEPLRASLSKYSDTSIVLWMREAAETAQDDLRDALNHHGLPFSDKITVLQECPGYDLLSDMIGESTPQWRYNRLIITVDLHKDDEKCMDNVNAFFICKEYPVNEKIRPVYLFQPMTEDVDLTESVTTFLCAEQTAPPKTLWYTGLSKAEKYPLFSALGEHRAAQNRLDLEVSLGARSAGYRWLALAIASDAVRYAQGPQLVAVSEKHKPEFTVLAQKLPDPVSEPDLGDYLPPVFYSLIAALLALVSAAAIWSMFVTPLEWGWSIFICLLTLVGSITTGVYLTQQASDKAWADVR